jgi:hypothetical protein
MDILSTILTSSIGGGATGLLGLLVQRIFDAQKEKADLARTKLQLQAAHDLRVTELSAQERMADKAHAAEALERQMALQAKEVEADTALALASIGADKATYLTDAQAGAPWPVKVLLGLVDFVRGLMRPGLTAYSAWLLTMAAWWLQELNAKASAAGVGAALTQAQLHELTVQVLGTIIYMATTTSVWWFGVRPAQPPKR